MQFVSQTSDVYEATTSTDGQHIYVELPRDNDCGVDYENVFSLRS